MAFEADGLQDVTLDPYVALKKTAQRKFILERRKKGDVLNHKKEQKRIPYRLQKGVSSKVYKWPLFEFGIAISSLQETLKCTNPLKTLSLFQWDASRFISGLERAPGDRLRRLEGNL